MKPAAAREPLAARPPLAALLHALFALTLAAAALLATGAAWADPPGRVGRIAQIDGALWTFDPEEGEWIAAKRNRPLTTGDRLSSERDARAELQIGSATVRLDEGTELEVTELDDDRVRLHLHHGAIALRLRSNESAREFSVSTREGRFEPRRAGHYRVDADDDGSFGAVIAGTMRFEASDSTLELAAGQRAEFWSERGVTHYSWSPLPSDRFADWVAREDRRDEREAQRRPYVSPEMTGAEDLDRYGEWERHPEYGTLWIPRRVEPGWAPYRYGQWAYVRPWGWTWVDDTPWGFAPFHYGRWVYWQNRWAWAPGQYVARPVYAPALVAWIGGSNFSVGINIGGPAVGWVPLSPREVYVPHYQVSPIYITHINSPYRRWQPPVRPGDPVRTGPIMYSNQGVPGGVTVVPQNVLRERRPISNAVVAPVDPATVSRWQAQQQPGNRGRAGESRAQVLQSVAPPPPVSRAVVAAPGGAVPVPAAPGAARNTPWGQVRNDDRRAPGRPRAPADAAPPTVAAPTPTAPQRQIPREAQERRSRTSELDREDVRRVAPPPQRQDEPRAARGLPPGQARRQAEPVAQPVAPVPPAQPAQVAPPVGLQPQAPVVIVPPAREAPGRGRGRDAGDERDDRQPPGQDRRRGPREQQN